MHKQTTPNDGASMPINIFPNEDFIRSFSGNRDFHESQSSLCCCEYVDREQKRYHLLGFCCNCVHFDRVFTDLITCRPIEAQSWKNMLLTFQDRLRIPWSGGAKQVSPVSIIPVVVLPVVIAIAAINAYVAIILLLTCSTFIGYIYYVVSKENVRTRFFSLWLLWSLVYMTVIFEYAVPLLELLPEENYLLLVLAAASIFMFWRTKKCAVSNHVNQSSVDDDELPDITEASTAEEEAAQTSLLLEHDCQRIDQPNMCSSCHKYMPARTDHCFVCGICIKRRDHHSYWLDCCIGEHNHRYYIAGLLFGDLALLLGANLTLTAVCHPFVVFRFFSIPVMLPDDCTEVFDEYELGLSFVIAMYAVLISVYVSVMLVRQIYFISRGITLQDCRRGQNANRKTIFVNWREFIGINF